MNSVVRVFACAFALRKNLRIEKETRKGKEIYEAVVNRDGKETALKVDPSGKYLGSHDEKAEYANKEKSEKD